MPPYYLVMIDPQALLEGQDYWREVEAPSLAEAAEMMAGALNELWPPTRPPLLPWTAQELESRIRPISEDGLWL